MSSTEYQRGKIYADVNEETPKNYYTPLTTSWSVCMGHNCMMINGNRKRYAAPKWNQLGVTSLLGLVHRPKGLLVD